MAKQARGVPDRFQIRRRTCSRPQAIEEIANMGFIVRAAQDLLDLTPFRVKRPPAIIPIPQR